MDHKDADGAPSCASKRQQAPETMALVLTDNENETTNCSETMSTANEDEEEEEEEFPNVDANCTGQIAAMTSAAANANDSPCRTSMATRVSVKNRPATPRRQPLASTGGDSMAQTFVRSHSNQSEAVAAAAADAVTCMGLVQVDDSTADTSLATLSGLQAPPSYGTATGGGNLTCATLDASQLATVAMSGADMATLPANRIYFAPSNHQHQQQQQQQQRRHANQIGQPLLTSMAAKTIGAPGTMQLPDLGGHKQRQTGLSAQLQEQSRQLALANNYAYGGGAQAAMAHRPAPQATAGGYLSSLSYSRSLPRFQLAAAAAAAAAAAQSEACGPKTRDDLCKQAGEHPQRQFNLRLTTPDNDQNAKSNVRYELEGFHLQQQLQQQQQQQQPRLQMFANVCGPINHVISAEGSIQQHSANQYYATGGQSAPGAAEVAAAAAVAPTRSLIPSQSSKESARLATGGAIMDAASTQQQQQQVALKMQQTLCWPPNTVQSTVPNRNQISCSINRRLEAHLNVADQQQQQQPRQFNEHSAWQRQANENVEATAGASNNGRQTGCQQVHKKRRRHKSGSAGRSVSPHSGARRAAAEWGRHAQEQSASLSHKVNKRRSLASLLSPTPINATQSLQRSSDKRIATVRARPTISAHCWLVDSSDDQTYTTARKPSAIRNDTNNKQNDGAIKTATINRRPSTKDSDSGEQHFRNASQPLTVAMIKQTLRQKQQQQQQQQQSHLDGPKSSLSRYLDGSSKQAAAALPPPQPLSNNDLYDQHDLTSNLKTNSLKMERLLSRTNQVASVGANYNSCSLRDLNQYNPRRAVHKKPARRRKPAESISSSSTEIVPAQTLMRLSSLLSFASNLARFAPKCLKQRNSAPPAPPNSISGFSVSTTSASGQLAAYTSASLAISSSSSTSAYATGSSSAATNQLMAGVGSNHPATNQEQTSGCSINMPTPSEQVLLAVSNINSSQQQQQQQQQVVKPASSGASTTGSSLFYSSSGTSGFQLATGNSLSHGYEYCDTLPIDKAAIDETPFNGDTSRNGNCLFGETSGRQSDGTSTTASSSSSSMSSRTREMQAGEMADEEARRLAHLLMSDNELLSAGSDSANAEANAGFNLPAVVHNAAPSVARRRWLWISAKQWLRRPCSSGSSAHFGGQVGAGEQVADCATGARYKSLRPARINTKQATLGTNGSGFSHLNHNNNHNNNSNTKTANYRGSSPSTLQNVISLAKADRVFRLRLIASLVVSLVLLALICLLAGLIYMRSAALYQRNKINLLIDESDYDLSWLWPQTLLPQGAAHLATLTTGAALNNAAASASAKLASGQSTTNNGPAYKVMDYLQWHSSGSNGATSDLDSFLRSQLMLIERSERLEQSQQTMTHLTNLQLANDYFIDITQLPEHWTTNSTFDSKLDRNKTTGGDSSPFVRSIDKTHVELAKLTLLSNLHWPLVKWRHQNQQSVANFLSFAMPSPRVSPAATQTIRSLLSLLMLTEQSTDTSNKQSPSMQSLHQFSRLNLLLQDTAKQVISCSLPTKTTNLRAKFCRLLISRYKRMMNTWSSLNHNHLAKLHGSFNQFNKFEPNQVDSNEDERQFKWASSSRTLFGFFLDRLALLDVQLLAESTWASNYEETDLIAEMEPDTDQAQLIEQLILQSQDDLFDQIEFGEPDNNNNNKWQMQSHLFEFAKSIIGEDPIKLNVNLEKNRQFQARFQQAEFDNAESWREQLNQDLLFPWPSFELPQFIEPLSYDLFLHPNLTTRLIIGMAKVEFQIHRATRYIVLNADQLNVVDLSLWTKSAVDVVSSKLDQSSSSSNNNNNNNYNYTLNNHPRSYTLKPVAIRRVLLNKKLEQIYIELDDTIGAKPELRSTGGSEASQLNFGELPRSQNLDQLRDSHFVLSISFNKTSLISSGETEAASGANKANNLLDQSKDVGLEFTQYGDYFAQPEVEMKTILYSRFEPFNARKLFPSFDEPHLKARFQLNLVHENNHQVLFNTPKRERVPYTADGHLQMSVFESTPIPLSTYLMSFIVCDAQNIRSITSRVAQLTKNNLPLVSSLDWQQQQQQQQQQLNQNSKEQRHIQVQILAQFEHLGQAEFASQLVPQLLTFYQWHLQLGYPLDKLDLMAIPRRLSYRQEQQRQVSSGKELFVAKSSSSSSVIDLQAQQEQLDTMENLGLIWFRAPLLLVDTNLISQNLIEQISKIISHQLAHQYFGNIVSIRRWQDLWLYESLCQYLESIALNSVQADWKLEEQFLISTIHETLELEQFSSSASQQQQQQQSEVDQVDAYPPSEQLASDEIAAAAALESRESQLDLSQLNDESSEIREEQVASEGEQLQAERSSNQQPTRPSELRKSSAILHMLMFNLLPTSEAKARLLRRCLATFQYKTMSRRQFWLQFGDQLAQANSPQRLPPNLSNVANVALPPNSESLEAETNLQPPAAAPPMNHETLDQSSIGQQLPPTGANERVVFVKPGKQQQQQHHHQRQQDERADVHRIRVRAPVHQAGRLMDNLELVANAWFERQGYPLITASVNRDSIILRQERFSFTWWDQNVPEDGLPGRGEIPAPEADSGNAQLDNVWPIPMMFVSRFNPKQARFFWMNKRELELPIDEYSLSTQTSSALDESHVAHLLPLFPRKGGHPITWFKLNVNQSSLIRVNYDERNWEALIELIMKPHYSNHLLSPLDRANLIDDALTLMRCGKLSVGIAMNLTLYLEVGERDFMPWTSALKHLDQMQTLLNQNPLWHRYVLKLMQPISSVIGWKDDGPHLMRKLRRHLFSVSLQYGDEKMVNKAKQEFKAWFKSNRYIVPNLQDLVYVAGVRYGDQQEWFHCWQRYQQLVALDQQENESSNQTNSASSQAPPSHVRDKLSQSNLLAGVGPLAVGGVESVDNEASAENEKRQLLTALASTHNTWLLEQFLNYSLDSTKIQPHHLKHVMQTLGKNPVARLYLWRFVRLNWEALADKHLGSFHEESTTSDRKRTIPFSNHILETMIVESTKHFATKLDYEEVKAFSAGKKKQRQYWSPAIEHAVQQSLQLIRSNIYWRDYIEPKLTNWLSHYDNLLSK